LFFFFLLYEQIRSYSDSLNAEGFIVPIVAHLMFKEQVFVEARKYLVSVCPCPTAALAPLLLCVRAFVMDGFVACAGSFGVLCAGVGVLHREA
jgi:hypothetical protein